MNPIQKQYLKAYVDTVAYYLLLEDFGGDPAKYLEAITSYSEKEAQDLLKKYEHLAQKVIAMTPELINETQKES